MSNKIASNSWHELTLCSTPRIQMRAEERQCEEMLVCMDRALFNLLTLPQHPDRWSWSSCRPLKMRGQGEERAPVNRLRRPSGTIDCSGQWGQLCTNCFFTSLWQRQQSRAGTHESYICFVAKAPGVNSLWLSRGLYVCECVKVCVNLCVMCFCTKKSGRIKKKKMDRFWY